MLLIVEIPFVDLRRFLSQETGYLSVPAWPSPVPDEDFIRSLGVVRRRVGGGLVGWFSEESFCDLSRSLRFNALPAFDRGVGRKNIDIRVPFRRLYFDGVVSGRVELGFATRAPVSQVLSRDQSKDFLEHILGLDAHFVAAPFKDTSKPFVNLRKQIAELYLRATTAHSFPQAEIDKKWLRMGAPNLYLRVGEDESIQLPGQARLARDYAAAGLAIHYLLFNHQGNNLPTWTMSVREGFDRRLARAIRMHLLRLYSELEVLRRLLRSIGDPSFTVEPRTPQSDLLQKYLLDTIRRLKNIRANVDKHFDNEVLSAVFIPPDEILPAEIDAIVQGIENARFRPNLARLFSEVTAALNSGALNTPQPPSNLTFPGLLAFFQRLFSKDDLRRFFHEELPAALANDLLDLNVSKNEYFLRAVIILEREDLVQPRLFDTLADLPALHRRAAEIQEFGRNLLAP